MFNKAWGELLLSLIFPIRCEICETSLKPSVKTGVCVACASEIKRIRPPYCLTCGKTLVTDSSKCHECVNEVFYFDRAFACAVYEGHAKELLHAYKFGRRKYLKSFFGGLLAEFVRKNIPADSYDCVVALPLDRERVRERGFNQSALLAENLSGCLEAPYFADLVSRRRSAFAQSSLKKEQRKENVRGRFQLRSNHKNIYGKKVLLIDDILTTGQTASECAKIIKSGGARSVTVLAVARGV